MSDALEDTMKLFRISELSDDSGTRDTLLDQMQEKMEEMLKINQELADAKAVIRDLQEQLKTKNETSGNAGNEPATVARNERQELKMIELRGKNKTLEKENEQLRNEIRELKNQIQEMASGSEEDLREQARQHDEELKSAVEEKESRISALESHIKELETLNSINNNSFLEQQSQVLNLTEKTHKMEGTMKDLERDKRALSDKITALNSEVEKLKLKIKSLSADCSRIENEKLQTEQVLEQVHLSNERNMTALNMLDEQYMTILAACESKTLEECLLFIEKSKKKLKQYKTKYPKLRRAYEEKKEEVQTLQTQLEKTTQQLEEMTEAKNTLEQQLKTVNTIRESMQHRLDRAERRDRIGTVFSTVNHNLHKSLSNVRSALQISTEQEPSLRSFIYMTLIMHRWLSLRGQPKRHALDARNWWWMDARESDCSDIVNSIHRLLHANKELEVKKEQLEEVSREKNERIECLSQEIARLTQENANQAESIEQLKTRIDEQEVRMQSMTDPADYNALAGKYANTKNAVKSLVTRLLESEDKVTELTAKLQDASTTRDQTMEIKQKIESELRVVQDEYEQKTEELELIYKELMERTKDMVALEHTLQSETTARTIMQSQVASLVKENELLQNQPFCKPEAPVRCTNLAAQLGEMAQNLRGTLC